MNRTSCDTIHIQPNKRIIYWYTGMVRSQAFPPGASRTHSRTKTPSRLYVRVVLLVQTSEKLVITRHCAVALLASLADRCHVTNRFPKTRRFSNVPKNPSCSVVQNLTNAPFGGTMMFRLLV